MLSLCLPTKTLVGLIQELLSYMHLHEIHVVVHQEWIDLTRRDMFYKTVVLFEYTTSAIDIPLVGGDAGHGRWGVLEDSFSGITIWGVEGNADFASTVKRVTVGGVASSIGIFVFHDMSARKVNSMICSINAAPRVVMSPHRIFAWVGKDNLSCL